MKSTPGTAQLYHNYSVKLEVKLWQTMERTLDPEMKEQKDWLKDYTKHYLLHAFCILIKARNGLKYVGGVMRRIIELRKSSAWMGD